MLHVVEVEGQLPFFRFHWNFPSKNMKMEMTLFLTNNNDSTVQERPAAPKDCDNFLLENINKNTKNAATETFVSVES